MYRILQPENRGNSMKDGKYHKISNRTVPYDVYAELENASMSHGRANMTNKNLVNIST